MDKLSIVFSILLVCATDISVATGQTPAPRQPAAPTQPAAPPEAAPAPGDAEAAAHQQQVSYALGRQFAMNLKRNDIPCDLRALFAGISDFMTNAKPKFTDEQLSATMERFAGEMEQRFKARIERNKQQEAEFLAHNKTQPGVQVTPSGLQYKVIQAGNGPSPTLTDTVRCNYRGQLLDGTEFDNSGGDPAEFRVDGVIQGWTEALQKMKVGDKWEVYVPSALAYDMEPNPNSGIEPASMLVFEIELLGIAPK